MADTDQKRIRSIFLAAVEDHAPDGWDDYLRAACEGEPELRQRVEVLLRGHKQPNELLDDPGAAPVAPSHLSIREGPGTVIGSYKLLEQIGEGGFGVVFMAEQQLPVRRKVALKIVKPGMDTRQVVARFEAERQALALMDHPNIAQIFDGGATESGRPYFVMELVRGIPITNFCNQQHLGVRERLELFAQVCQAVQHAHQKGIIHRDLKPTNIMVTRHDVTPVVKIIDFGIAKATGQQLTDKTLFTNFAQMIGTPMYMSPEQAQMSGLDVDTRSDVYSLGVLLYELLTGSTPFEKERLRTVAYDEMIRIIREEEPVRPSTRISTLGHAAKTAPIDRNGTPQKLSQLFRGELDWIVMKALEKDRNRRYDSASALANEVQRYLNDEPVLACPPTVGYRLRKLARRHKAALATAAMVFVALAAGTAVAVWQAVVATQAKQVALDAAAAEKDAKLAVEAKEREARAAIDFLEDRVLRAARAEGLDGGLGQDVLLRDAVEAAVPFVQDGFKDQPLIEARLRLILAQSFEYSFDGKRCVEQAEAARAIYTKLYGPRDRATLKSFVSLARGYQLVGRFEEARKLHDETLATLKDVCGPDDDDTLRCMNNLAMSYHALGRYADALKLHEERLALCKAKWGPDHPETLRSMGNLADSYASLGRNGEALTMRENLVAIHQANLGADHATTLEARKSLAGSYETHGRFREAHQLHSDVLSKRKVVLGPTHPSTLSSMYSVAGSLKLLGRYQEALKLEEETLARKKEKYGPDHTSTLSTMNALANSYDNVGRHAEALALHEETSKLRKVKLGPDHADTLDSMHNLASAYRRAGRNEEALKLDTETLARRQTVLGANHQSTLRSMNSLAACYRAMGRHAEALELFQRTVLLRTDKLGAKHPETLNSLANAARSLMALDRGAEAVAMVEDCVRRAMTVETRPAFVNDLLWDTMRHFIAVHDLAGCRKTADIWHSLGRTDLGNLYHAAAFHALIARLIRDRYGSVEMVIQSKIEENRAMEWLQKSFAAGFKNTSYIVNDRNLDILRERPDFIELMTQLPPLPKKDNK